MALPNLLRSLGVGASTPVAANAQAPTVPTSQTAAPAPSLPSFNRTATAAQGSSSLLNVAAPTAAQTQATGNTPAGTAARTTNNPLLQGFSPDRLQALFNLQQQDISRAEGELERGAIHPLDQTGRNPVGFKVLFEQAVRRGENPEIVAARLNQRIANEPTVADYFRNLYAGGGTPRYLQEIIASGFLGPRSINPGMTRVFSALFGAR